MWLVIHIRRRTYLLNLTLTHNHYAVAQSQRLFLVVGHIYKGNTQFLVHLAQLHLHVFAHLQVQRCQGLIQQQYLWLIDNSTSNSHTLLLTTTQTRHIAILIIGHTYRLECVLHFLLNELFVHLLEFQTKSHIVIYIQVWEQGILLKHRVHIAQVWRHSSHVLAIEQNISFARYLKTCYTTQQRRLTAT